MVDLQRRTASGRYLANRSGRSTPDADDMDRYNEGPKGLASVVNSLGGDSDGKDQRALRR